MTKKFQTFKTLLREWVKQEKANFNIIDRFLWWLDGKDSYIEMALELVEIYENLTITDIKKEFDCEC